MLFNSINYRLLGIAILLIMVGFIAMYIENEVNGIISLFISPILILAGYGLVVFAILKKTTQPSEN